MAKTKVKEIFLYLVIVLAGCLAMLAVYITQFKSMNEINRLKFELKVQTEKFEKCKNRLGVFYMED